MCVLVLEGGSLMRLAVISERDSCMNFICWDSLMDAFTLLVRLLLTPFTRLKGIVFSSINILNVIC